MARLKVLMFGWEFPPFNSGGLGVACQSLSKALFEQGARVLFVLPWRLDCRSRFCRIIFAAENSATASSAVVSAYAGPGRRQGIPGGFSLLEQVRLYAEAAGRIAREQSFDIIHSHDWLSFPAGLKAKEVSQKPFIAHIHATEFDRTGGWGINREVFEIEKEALLRADRVLAVSNFTKEKLVKHYGIDPAKIRVVYNAAVDSDEELPLSGSLRLPLKENSRIVLFLGRITLQKGPDYFLQAAKKVLEKEPSVFFIMAGSGDMREQIIEQSAWLGIADRVIFTGFLRGDALRQIYQMADLYVLSSVSEPFGLTALEALKHQTPVLISRQSGVSEVLDHCLKVDFWDIDEMANKILAVLRHSELQQELRNNGYLQACRLTWQDSARKCLEVYEEALR